MKGGRSGQKLPKIIQKNAGEESPARRRKESTDLADPTEKSGPCGKHAAKGENAKTTNNQKEREKKMAKIQMMSGIASISGRLGNYCFRTMRASGKVYMHTLPGKDERLKEKGERKEPCAEVVQQRVRFGAITKMVAQMRKDGSRKSQKQLWKIAQEAYDAAHK